MFLGWLCPALGSGFGGWLVRVFVFVVCFVCVFCGVCLCGLPGWVCLAVGLWQFGWPVVLGWVGCGVCLGISIPWVPPLVEASLP